MTLRVYIAAASREVDRVRAAQAAVAERGWELTFDWLTPILDNLARGVRDTDLSLDEQRRHALEEVAAIDAADVLWCLAPREPTKGTWWELGYAHGKGMPIVVTGGLTGLFLALTPPVGPDDDGPAALEEKLRTMRFPAKLGLRPGTLRGPYRVIERTGERNTHGSLLYHVECLRCGTKHVRANHSLYAAARTGARSCEACVNGRWSKRGGSGA